VKDTDYLERIALLKKWVAAYPESATARISLAQAYLNEGTFGRGTSYANDVSAAQWAALRRGIEQSKATLLEAAKRKEKDPYWYETMQVIAQFDGWDKDQTREVLNQGAAFEPTYYHYYRQYANSLQTKWGGEPGELLAFAKNLSNSLGEPTGSMAYFELTSVLSCACGDFKEQLATADWPLVKRGYENTKRLYGISNLKANRFAAMAYAVEDKTAARDAFQSIDSIAYGIWVTSDWFGTVKHWAYDSGD
jgi:hypothetical protein